MMITKEPDITFKGLYYFPAFPISKAVHKRPKCLKVAKVLLVILLMEDYTMKTIGVLIPEIIRNIHFCIVILL